ncbi:phosphoribosylglycinamide formyltransferase [Ihubacter massiliensis]|uniref:Phosphoribosylglycinamide formyltransferase n=1 Tax=Hominibacterium faecale TaxID=2839743 RepID=A0A9J6QSK4_9FIRM|nr:MULTISPECIES: phosphoribosylglycinamide formyltransferase [Eubacteriales Family XIII. Incertae Sedis]MCO7123179.1 phosphoribosylglycinamide formyltransferase [Ihubacter massiliensis]MCU7377439.1 phosphoribosylglycinamide formyltransferase [Hominibacterium faecale]
MVNISVLVSGGGTNLQALIDKIQAGELEGVRIVQVIASREDAYALERAAKAGIKGKVVKETGRLLSELASENTDLIVLAGYMKVLEPAVIDAYRKRIVNIHPSLIPKYCGKGFYGKRVHQAVIDGKEKVSGATVHFVDEGVDTGEIILQREVPVEPGDTADTLAARVLKTEHVILAEGIKKVMAELPEKEGGKKWAE